ncbi:MAG: acetyl-CoA carboxylase biotin carboxyl carrier protein [Planctomycetota bacterium]|nr:acetyl-CoA carboxylase biotin carboxyl carrier protein [Planctomycetota bacterium]
MDVREIKKLISLMNENGLARLEVEEEGKRYLIEKAGASGPVGQPLVVSAPAALAAPGAHLAEPAASAAPAAATEPQQPEDTVTFNSPMVGTFYRTASPEVGSFVEIGDKVQEETVVCLIEAMKVFNEIKAEMSGTIVEVLAENGEAVEYNQPLYLIKP